jgi:hypothetical protein
MMPNCGYKRCKQVGMYKVGLCQIEWFHPYLCKRHYIKIAKKLGWQHDEEDFSAKLKENK